MPALLFLLAVALQLPCGLTVAVGHLRSLTVSTEDATKADTGYAAPLGSSADLERADGGVSNQLDVEAGARRTRMQCLGSQTLTRACHFEDVYYDLRSSRFVHYGIEGATPDVFGDDQKRGEPWLRLVRGYHSWQAGEEEARGQFHMDWRPGEPLPAAEEVVTYTQPLHLRGPYNTRSIGHLIRDNLQFLIDLPLRFGRDPAEFDWVRWESKLAFSDWEEETPTAEHYRGLLNNRPSLTWKQVLNRALSGADRSSVQYIRFAELIAGQGPADVLSQLGTLWADVTSAKVAAWAHMCDPFPFSEMRRVAYRNYGLKAASVHDLEPFVLFLDGKEREKRHLANAGELLPRLKATFPGVRMEHVEISAHPLEKQLQLLSKATVLVSNIGSRSFRLIYLPNGATTILVGPPEYAFELEPLPSKEKESQEKSKKDEFESPYTIQRPFLEIDWCWGYIGYVNMLRYRVETEAEVRRRPEQPWTKPMFARNTDVVLREDKLTALLRIALERAQHSTAQRGGGELSAYSA